VDVCGLAGAVPVPTAAGERKMPDEKKPQRQHRSDGALEALARREASRCGRTCWEATESYADPSGLGSGRRTSGARTWGGGKPPPEPRTPDPLRWWTEALTEAWRGTAEAGTLMAGPHPSMGGQENSRGRCSWGTLEESHRFLPQVVQHATSGPFSGDGHRYPGERGVPRRGLSTSLSSVQPSTTL